MPLRFIRRNRHDVNCTKFVPRLLTDGQKQQRLEVSMDLKEHVRNDPEFLSKVTTGDLNWIDGYDPEIKQQSSQWKCSSSPWLKKTLQVKSSVKSMPICFFDSDGIVHKEFVPPGQTVNAKFCCDFLGRLSEHVRRKRPDRWHTNDWVFHHDNDPMHTTLAVQQFLASRNMIAVPQSSYSSDLASCGFLFFLKMKIKMKG